MPQDILRDGGFNYNPFAFQAGVSSGWQLFGLLSYVLGGPRGFTALSAWALLGVMMNCYGSLSLFRSRRDGMIGACAVAAVWWCVIGDNDRTGNDVGLLFFTSAAFSMALRGGGSARTRGLLIGVTLGMAVGIKFTSVPTCLLIAAAFVLRTSRGTRLTGLACLIAGATPLASIWPLFTYLRSGSPLPQLAMALRTRGPPLPQLSEALTHDMNGYLGYLPSALFSRDLLPLVILFAGGIVLLASPGLGPLRRRAAALSALGVAHWLLLALVSPVTWFHARYNLTSFLLLALAGSLGWSALEDGARSPLRNVAAGLTLLLACWCWGPLDFLSRVDVRTQDFFVATGARTSHVACFNWIDANLPSDAVLAGTAIETFYTHRRYLQMQAISQEQIDLRLPPQGLLVALRHRGVTHLHLTNEYDLPPWSVEMAALWARNLERIADLPGVILVYEDARPRVDSTSEHTVKDRLYRLP